MARDAGVKIVAVGLGSETGSEITLTDPQTGAKTKLMYEGKPVISKLDGDQLRKIALVTEGAYIPAGTSAIDLESIMESHVAADRARRGRRGPARDPGRALPVARARRRSACLLAALWVGAGRHDGSRADPACRMVAGSPASPAACARRAPRRARQATTTASPRSPRRDSRPPRRRCSTRAARPASIPSCGSARRTTSASRTRRTPIRCGSARTPISTKALDLAQQAASWFGDAGRLRPDDADTRANLAIVRARVQAISDELRKGEGKLEARLDAADRRAARRARRRARRVAGDQGGRRHRSARPAGHADPPRRPRARDRRRGRRDRRPRGRRDRRDRQEARGQAQRRGEGPRSSSSRTSTST